MSRYRHLARDHAFDLLIGLLVLAAMLELIVRRDTDNAPETPLWLTLPTVALLALSALGRRRYAFAAPAGFWLFAAALSFVDGRLVPFAAGVFLIGMAASFLLGNLGKQRQRLIGLAIVLGSAGIIVYNQPEHGPEGGCQ